MASLLEDLRTLRGKRILITGHTGFKGSWLALLLVRAGAKVSGVALPPITEQSHWDLLRLATDIESHECDIRDREKLSKHLRVIKPEIVFHLAAQALVRKSYREPYLTFTTNVLGSANVLDIIREQDSVRTLVYITSDKCYRNKEQVLGYVETDELGGLDPYSTSKAAAEHIFAGYMQSSYNHPAAARAASARAGNVVGGGDWSPDRLIPDCIRAATTSQPISLRFPYATRPWQHVLEPLSGYVRLAVALEQGLVPHGEPWNFGPSEDSVHQVQEVTEILASRWHPQLEVRVESRSHQLHESGLLQLNSNKAHKLLNWQPQWNFAETIERTTDWYREFYSGGDARSLSLADIAAYTDS